MSLQIKDVLWIGSWMSRCDMGDLKHISAYVLFITIMFVNKMTLLFFKLSLEHLHVMFAVESVDIYIYIYIYIS